MNRLFLEIDPIAEVPENIDTSIVISTDCVNDNVWALEEVLKADEIYFRSSLIETPFFNEMMKTFVKDNITGKKLNVIGSTTVVALV